MFTTLVAESASSALLNPVIYLGVPPSDIPLLTREQEDALLPIVSSLRSLPIPTTHPSHPASSGNLKILNQAQDGYADMRSGWAKRCLELRSRELVRHAEDADNGIQTSFEFAQWVEGLLLLAEVSVIYMLLNVHRSRKRHRRNMNYSGDMLHSKAPQVLPIHTEPSSLLFSPSSPAPYLLFKLSPNVLSADTSIWHFPRMALYQRYRVAGTLYFASLQTGSKMSWQTASILYVPCV